MNETDEYGYTGLHMAVENGHLDIVNILLVSLETQYYLILKFYNTVQYTQYFTHTLFMREHFVNGFCSNHPRWVGFRNIRHFFIF